MSDDELPSAPKGGGDIGVVVLMLGLYLIVLAFFILLNAISEDSPEKRDLVVESVREGFAFKEEGELLGSDDTDIKAIPLYKITEDAIEGIIQTYLSFEEYDIQQKADRLFVSVDIRRFFKPREAVLIPEMILFFEDLGSVLGNPKPGLRILSEIMVRGNEIDVIPGKTALTTAGARAALFTRALIENGVKPAEISAAAMVDAPRIIMIFEIQVIDYSAALNSAAAMQNLESVLEGGSMSAVENVVAASVTMPTNEFEQSNE